MLLGSLDSEDRLQPGDLDGRCMGMDGNAEVYAKYRGDLLRYATSLVGPDSAEDLVSIVVLRTISRRDLGDLEKPKAYLMKGVLNEARSLWRKPKASPLAECYVRHLPVEVVETLDAVWQLPVQQRAAAFLFYWEDMTVSGIAEIMGVRQGTVKRYLYIARQRLKRSLS